MHSISRGLRALVPSLMSLGALAAVESGERLVVVGERLPLAAEDAATARVEADLQAGGTTVIDAESFKRGRASTYADMLGFAPGVFIQPRHGADESRLSIRGSGLQRTFHMRGILLLADGIPVSLADGSGDFQSVAPPLLDHLTVYRGANGHALGGATLGGVIDFVSPTGRTAAPVEASFEGGSFGYARGTISGGAEIGNWDFWAGTTISESDGFRDHARSQDQRFQANAGYRFTDHLENRAFFGYSDTDSELPGSLTRAQMEEDPTQAVPGNIVNDAHRDFPLYRVGDRLSWAVDDHRVDVHGGYSHKELFHPLYFSGPTSAPVGPVIDQRSDDGIGSVRYQGELGSHRLTLLVSYASGLVHDQRYANARGERGARTDESYQRSSNGAVDLGDEMMVIDGTWVSMGTQFVRATRDFDDRFGAVDNSDDFTYRQANPRVGLRQRIGEEAQLYGNLSRSFDPPSFGELVPVGTNPGLLDLEAQKAWTAELGSRGGIERASWDVSAYYAWIRDELLSYQTAPSQSTTRNADHTRHAGLELGGEVVPIDGLMGDGRIRVRGSYLFSWFRFDDDAQFGDNRIAGLPPHAVKVETLYEFLDGWYAGPTVEAASAGYVDHANTEQAPGWGVLGAKAGYRAASGFSTWVEGRNLLGKTYAATYGVVTTATPASAVYNPGDGRAVYAGAGWRW